MPRPATFVGAFALTVGLLQPAAANDHALCDGKPLKIDSRGSLETNRAACRRLIRSGSFSRAEVSRLWVKHGSLYSFFTEPVHAVADYTKALEFDPTNADAYEARATAHRNAGNYDLALADASAAIRLNPAATHAYGTRAEAYAKTGNPDAGEADALAALRLAGTDLKGHLEIAFQAVARAFEKIGRHDRAAAVYSAAIEAKLGTDQFYSDRAWAVEKAGNLDLAITYWGNAADAFPSKRAVFLYSRARVYGEKGDFPRAIADYSEAIRLESDDSSKATYYSVRAQLFAETGNFQSALSDMTETIRLSKSEEARADRLSDRARMFIRAGNLDAAIADYNEALERDRNGYYFALRGELLQRRGDKSRAVADFDAAIAYYSAKIQKEPKNGAHYSWRAWVFESKGDSVKALSDRDDAIRLAPNSAGRRYSRGALFEKLGDFAKALIDYRMAATLGDADDQYGKHVARIEAKIAGRDQAVQTASRADEQVRADRVAAVAQPESPAKPGSNATEPQRESRMALIIGNSAYANAARLPNPKNDAELIGATLRRTGFNRVDVHHDLGRDNLLDTLKAFAAEADKADWAIVYFAGHGMEIGGVNYLLPVDAKLRSDRDVPYEAISVDQVLHAVGGTRKLKLVVLDACRDNPFLSTMTRSASTRAVGRGLAQMEPDSATLVAFAAKHGQVAQDGEGANSPFAAALARAMEMPGLEISLLLRRVRDDVLNATGRRQEPFTYGSLPSEGFYFKKP